MSPHAYHAQLVKLPLSLGELVESHELKQRRVHGLLHLAKTLDVDRVCEVLSVPQEGIKKIFPTNPMNIYKTEGTNLLLTPSMRAVPPRIFVSRTNEPELAADSRTEKYLNRTMIPGGPGN